MYRHDFTVFDRYLDLAEKHMGKPRIVVLYVWDLFIGGRKSRHQTLQHPGIIEYAVAGVPVTLLDEATGKTSTVNLPSYTDAKSLALWKPVVEGIRDRLRKRGLEKAAVLGLGSDGRPSQEIVDALGKLFPGVPWARQGHQEWKKLGRTGASLGFQANVVPVKFLDDPAKGKYACHGWNRPDMRVLYFRTGLPSCPLVMSRLLGELNIQGWQRGFSRIGFDFWPVMKDRRGRVTGTIHGRYPKSSWRQLDRMIEALAHPGPDGAAASVRLEMMREGLQECEVRIFIERALMDDVARGKLGRPLVDRCEAVLAERARHFLPVLEYQQQAGFEPRAFVQINGAEHGFNYEGNRGMLFFQWYSASGWQKRSEQLYTAAADVATALGK